MPMKRGYKKSRRRRPTGRSRGGYKKSRRSRIPRAIGPRNHTYAKLAYGRITTSNISAGALLTETFCINGMFDPEVALGGNQPLYFDQFMAMYRNYRVFACKVIVKLSCGSSTNNMFHGVAAMHPSSNSTPPYGSIQTAYQQRQAVHKTLVPTAGAVTMKSYYKISNVLGLPKLEVGIDDNLSGDATVNPNIKAFSHVYIKNNDGTNVLSVTYEVKLIFYAKFYNLVEVAAS